ncbi:hypothetical protein BCR32DRAFT_282354 [Anaeromyces robustus]|uniref:Uncharacterized protein n=1 Tax=Anaeromyces robustus TaxID=1754192 RepID=A0A1Y1WXU2_9FUNG|nr:hypothetical protein BCR32DRAFT_282354 [Anaeromyces robustus]|eukprot:ORX78370.1 hypothetical protein BCR32DRAFT_282354 [Anaeromyces robustus]
MNKRHWHFELKERETNKGEGFENLLNIHFFELQKYMNIEQEELENKFTWFFFLNDPNNKYFRNKETPTIFKEAREKLLTLKGDKNFYQVYLQREKDYYDVIAAREEGEAEGEIKGEIKIAVKMILDKFKEDMIEKYTGLSEAKINILKEFLNEPNYQIDVLKSKLNLKLDENEILEIIENCKIFISQDVKAILMINILIVYIEFFDDEYIQTMFIDDCVNVKSNEYQRFYKNPKEEILKVCSSYNYSNTTKPTSTTYEKKNKNLILSKKRSDHSTVEYKTFESELVSHICPVNNYYTISVYLSEKTKKLFMLNPNIFLF